MGRITPACALLDLVLAHSIRPAPICAPSANLESVRKHTAMPLLPRSWQGLHPALNVIYTVDQLAVPSATGGVSAFSFDSVDGTISSLDKAVPVGDNPVCVIAVGGASANRSNVMMTSSSAEPPMVWSAIAAAVYTSGAVATIPIDSNGRIVGAPHFTNHSGSSKCTAQPAAARGTSPHPHGVFVHPLRPDLLFVPDLGLDMVFQYRYDAAAERLTALSPPTIAAETCSGPRHMAFTTSGKWATVLHEMASTLTVYRWDDTKTSLSTTPVEPPASTLPQNQGWGYCSSPNCR